MDPILNDELQLFNHRLIDEIDEDMQQTETRLTSLTKRVNKAIKNSSGESISLFVFYYF